MEPNKKTPWIDRAIEWFSPEVARHRAVARLNMQLMPQYEKAVMQAANVYDSATQSRLDNSWPASRSLKGSNAPLNRWRQTKLRDRSRELDRNNMIATGILDRCAENVIGSGLRLRATTEDPEFNKRADDLWKDWIESADITGMCGGAAEFESLLFRSMMRDGDVGINLVSRGNDAWLQAIEGDLIDTLGGGNDPANNVLSGIMFNGDSRPAAFCVLSLSDAGAQLKENWIPSRNFIFYSRRKSLSDTRGEPCFAQSDRMLDFIDGNVEAIAVSSRIAACFGIAIKSANSALTLGNLPTQSNSQGKPQRIEQMEPGQILRLNNNDDIITINPSQPGQQFDSLITAMIRFVGVPLGLPLELVFLDFSRTTYSSARASLLQAYRVFRGHQQRFISTVMARIYRWRISKWVKEGALVPSEKIANDYWRHEWIANGWTWIDPVKELQAAMMEIDAGINSEENIALQHGRTIEDIYQSKDKAAKLAKGLGLVISRSAMTREMIMQPNGQPALPGSPLPIDKTDPETGEDLPSTDD